MDECIICFEETTEFITFPCDHKVCAGCYPQLRRCPLCNIEIIPHTPPPAYILHYKTFIDTDGMLFCYFVQCIILFI